MILKFANKFDSDIWDVLFHNTKILSINNSHYDIEYKNHNFKIEFNSKEPDFTYYDFFAYMYQNKSLPKNIFSKYALVFEGESYHEFSEIRNSYKILLSDTFSLNSNYLFSQTVFKWNRIAGIRWFYEFKETYKNLNPPHKFGYFVGRKSNKRTELGNLLFDTDGVFVNHWRNKEYNPLTMKCHQLNDWESKIDFHNLFKVHPKPSDYNFDLDFFFRVLPTSKIVILEESNSLETSSPGIDWLTERTYGYILAKIPFIPVSYNILGMIYEVFDIRKYPFESDIKYISADPHKIKNYIDDFNKDYDKNYDILNKWVVELHDILMKRIETENSLLDLLLASSKNLTKNLLF